MSKLIASIIIGSVLLVGCKKPYATQTPDFVQDARLRVEEVPLWVHRIAVVDPQVIMTSTDVAGNFDIKASLVEKVETAFVQTGRFDLIERHKLESLKKEIALNETDWFDKLTANKKGGFYGAKYLVLPTAEISSNIAGSNIKLIVKIVDVETGVIVQKLEHSLYSASLFFSSPTKALTNGLTRFSDDLYSLLIKEYPPRGVVVQVVENGTYLWVQTKNQVTKRVKKGDKITILRNELVHNSVTNTYSYFTLEDGTEAKVISIQAEGIVCKVTKCKDKKALKRGAIVEFKQ